MSTHTTQITIDDIKVDVEVEYTAYPASRGHRDKHGAPEEPDEPATIEIESVIDVTDDVGNLLPSLSKAQVEKLEEEIGESLSRERDYPDPPEPDIE